MNNSRVKTDVNGEESDLFLDKIENLLQTATFNDISFNCKDGKISGNRLILSIYSNFLTSIFTNNPLIISHPLSDDSDNGINLTEVSVKDVSNLVNILNSGKCGRIKAESLAGLLKVAKLLKIELIKGQKVNGFVKVEAVPVLLEKENEDEEEEEEEEEDDEKFDLKKVKVECEQSMVEGDESRDFPGVHDSRFFREEMDLDFEEAKQSKGENFHCLAPK
ncbi:hypothetical protein B4U80_13038 [Leptotrombidium deliense]|uniref:BTB domain-containing protein n=1 Tax=Leptotrombidium deliense TaxID=299467 RepID=A0A443SV14_9ACAR|nr:hypothetical protein B4U80_13038 [Leptotrombidium deliense]